MGDFGNSCNPTLESIKLQLNKLVASRPRVLSNQWIHTSDLNNWVEKVSYLNEQFQRIEVSQFVMVPGNELALVESPSTSPTSNISKDVEIEEALFEPSMNELPDELMKKGAEVPVELPFLPMDFPNITSAAEMFTGLKEEIEELKKEVDELKKTINASSVSSTEV